MIASPAGVLPAPAPISYAEIEAFTRTTLADLTAADVALIRMLDLQFIRIATGVPDPDQPRMTLGRILRERAAEERAARARGEKGT